MDSIIRYLANGNRTCEYLGVDKNVDKKVLNGKSNSIKVLSKWQN